jgi:chitinase
MPLNAGQACRQVRVLLPILGLSFGLGVARAAFWTTGYYPGWEQAAMPAANIDFAALTHVVHFAVVPKADGTVNRDLHGITLANAADLVSCAHAAGRKALICVGGADSETGFQGATSPANLPSFIGGLTNLVTEGGYDGVDLDWEPLTAADAPQYIDLVRRLRAALDLCARPELLTAAVGAFSPYGDPPGSEYDLFARLQSEFDQINLMTYDLSGAYAGWVTWFNSPVHDGGFRFPSSGALLPSVDAAVGNFVSHGVRPAKLGLGIPFYGYAWMGANLTAPRQSWTKAPKVTQLPYDAIVASYYQSNHYHWDTNAQAAFLGVTNRDPAADMFISYDDPRACQVKAGYARNHALGGVMIWELAQDHQPGRVDPLLQALKQALNAPGLSRSPTGGDHPKLAIERTGLEVLRAPWAGKDSADLLGGLQAADPSYLATQPRSLYHTPTPR